MGLQATNAGINFQQRVSALMMILMEFGINVSSVLRIENANERINMLDFEACESIDDLVITLESGKRIYFQMKRTISLSDAEDSEFYKVCNQFVQQSIKYRTYDIAYVLMTRSEASNAIVQKLRKVLDGIRLSRNLDFILSLNVDERTAFEKYVSNIKKIYQSQTGETISDQALLSLCLKTYVETLDIESGESFEKNVFLMLHDKLRIDPVIFWECLIARAVEYGANRRNVSSESLSSFFDEYKDKPNDDEEICIVNAITEWKQEFTERDIRFDYVVCKPNKKTQINFHLDASAIMLIELFRFNESEKKNYRFVTPNMLYLQNGMELEVMFRSSTRSMCEDFFATHSTDEKAELIVIPAKKGEVTSTPAETMHKSLILNSLEKIGNTCTCINCGKGLTNKEVKLIEIDNTEAMGIAGLAHVECIRPVDRVIGMAYLKISDEMCSLNKFNINKWIELIGKGKTAWESIKSLSVPSKAMIVNDFEVFEDGNYCICNILENDDKRYFTQRGKIDRLGKKAAEKILHQFLTQMANANKDGIYYGYSSESMSFCTNIQCKESFPTEGFLKIIDARIEPYNKVIASIYSDSLTYYAPIIYFSVDGEPLILNNGIFPLLSDPLFANKCINNWKEYGNNITDYEMCIIESDNEFILKISRLIMQQIRPVVNPIFVPSEDTPLGTIIYLQWEIETHEIEDSGENQIRD